MNTLRARWRHVAVFFTSMITASCSFFHDDTESQWRTLVMIRPQPRAELGNHVDARCVDSANVAPGDVLVVVKYRVGRARRYQAFQIPNGRFLREGDTVVVHSSQCLPKDAASTS